MKNIYFLVFSLMVGCVSADEGRFVETTAPNEISLDCSFEQALSIAKSGIQKNILN